MKHFLGHRMQNTIMADSKVCSGHFPQQCWYLLCNWHKDEIFPFYAALLCFCVSAHIVIFAGLSDGQEKQM